MHRGLLQDRTMVDHTGGNIPAHVDGGERETDRDRRDVPGLPNGHRTGVGDMGLVRRDDDATVIHRSTLVGPRPCWGGYGLSRSADVDAMEGQRHVERHRETTK